MNGGAVTLVSESQVSTGVTNLETFRKSELGMLVAKHDAFTPRVKTWPGGEEIVYIVAPSASVCTASIRQTTHSPLPSRYLASSPFTNNACDSGRLAVADSESVDVCACKLLQASFDSKTLSEGALLPFGTEGSATGRAFVSDEASLPRGSVKLDAAPLFCSWLTGKGLHSTETGGCVFNAFANCADSCCDR